MTHVTNHSPSCKTFVLCFIVSVIIATVVIYSYCGNIVAKELGDEVDKHDGTIVLEELVVEISKVENTTKKKERITQTTLQVKRTNTLYYVNDNGYKYYLDDKYQDHLYKMCVKYNVEKYYTLLLAQMYHESSFDIDVISKTSDHGLMQINVCNHKWLGKKLGNNDFLDPYNNIEAGTYMMSTYLHKYNDVEKALVCYNRGESAVRKGIYSTSYSKGVLSDMNLLVELK